MAQTDRKVGILINAKDEASSVLNTFNVTLAATAAAAAAVAAGFLVMGKAFLGAVRTAADQQTADVQLAAALRTLGQNTQEVRDDFTEFANTLQDLTITDDRVVKSVGGVLASLGQLSGTELKRATKATLDFSAALGQDSVSAALLVAKAADGYVSALTRYGIKVDESVPKSEQFNAALEIMEKKFGGIAEAIGKTFTGRLTRVTNDLNDAAEQIGDVVVRSQGFNNILDALSDTAKGFQDSIKDSSSLMKDFEKVLLDVTLTAGLVVVSFAEMALTILQVGVKLSAFTSTVQEFGKGLTAGSGGLATLLFGLSKVSEEFDELADSEIEVNTQTAAAERSIQSLKKVLQELGGALKREQENLRRVAELERIVGEEGFNTERGVRALRELSRLHADPILSVEEALGNIAPAADDAAESVGRVKTQLNELDTASKELKADFDEAVTLFELGPDKDGITEEQFDALVAVFKSTGQSIREAGGDVQDFLTTMGRVPDEIITNFSEATEAVVTFGETLQEDVIEQGVRGAQQLGSFFVDAAFGAQKSFGEFAKAFLKQIAAMIAQAFILKGLMSFGTFGIGGAGAGAFSVIPGLGNLFESVPSGFIPAPPPPLASVIMSGRAATQPTSNIFVQVLPAPDAREQALQFVEAQNDLAERFGLTVVATEIAD
jgi:hypothetical protein